jgi:hypothetical protein
MMWSIYQSAERIVIWPSAEGEDRDYGLEFLKRMNNLTGSSMWYTRQKVEALLESQENIRRWRSVDALFARSYWTRAWI